MVGGWFWGLLRAAWWIGDQVWRRYLQPNVAIVDDGAK